MSRIKGNYCQYRRQRIFWWGTGRRLHFAICFGEAFRKKYSISKLVSFTNNIKLLYYDFHATFPWYLPYYICRVGIVPIKIWRVLVSTVAACKEIVEVTCKFTWFGKNVEYIPNHPDFNATCMTNDKWSWASSKKQTWKLPWNKKWRILKVHILRLCVLILTIVAKLKQLFMFYKDKFVLL